MPTFVVENLSLRGYIICMKPTKQTPKDKVVLVVITHYPPLPGIGPINVSKITKYFIRYNWQPIVLTCSFAKSSSAEDLEISQECVFRANCLDISIDRAIFSFLKNLLRGAKSHPLTEGTPVSIDRKNRVHYRIFHFIRKLRFSLAGQLFYIPDPYIGWYPIAVKRGLELIKRYCPNIIFASSPSHTAQLVAFTLSLLTGIPWIAHLRDPWTINPYYSKIGLALILEKMMERIIFKKATAIIVVSEGYADYYAKISHKAVHVIHNGFDPDDFPKDIEPYKHFVIFFAGSLYEGRRDTTPLLQAVRELKEEGCLNRFPLKIIFHLRPEEIAIMNTLAHRYNVADVVSLRLWEKHKFIIGEECKSTYLLLPLWRSPNEKYTYSGKLFEYMGTNRPILCIASRDNLAARLISSLGIGVVCERKDELKTFLQEALLKFYTQGGIESIVNEKVKSFSWPNQVEKIVGIFEEAIFRCK